MQINYLNRWNKLQIFFREVNSYIFILIVCIIFYFEYLVLMRQSYLDYLQIKIFIKRHEGRSWRYFWLWKSLITCLYHIEIIWFLRVSLRLYYTLLFIAKWTEITGSSRYVAICWMPTTFSFFILLLVNKKWYQLFS